MVVWGVVRYVRVTLRRWERCLVGSITSGQVIHSGLFGRGGGTGFQLRLHRSNVSIAVIRPIIFACGRPCSFDCTGVVVVGGEEVFHLRLVARANEKPAHVTPTPPRCGRFGQSDMRSEHNHVCTLLHVVTPAQHIS